MRRLVPIGVLCCLMFALPALAFEDALMLPPAGEMPSIQVTDTTSEGVRLELELPELKSATVEMAGRAFDVISIAGGGLAGDIGAPAIPNFSRFVAVPDGRGVEVTVEPLEVETRDNVFLAPLQDGDPNAAFVYDEAAYARDALISGDTGGTGERVTVGEPAVLRDLRVVDLTFRPVRYNAATRTLEITRRMRVEVAFTGDDPRAARRVRRSTIPPSFDRIYRDVVVNYEGPDASQSIAPGTDLLICYNNANVIDRLQPLIEWRQRKGSPVLFATTAQTGTSTTSIKNFIQGVYDDPSLNLEYVTLVGDASGTYALPCFYENLSFYHGEGDHPYTTLEGSDILSDVHIGRLSFNGSDLVELERIVNKIVGYETDPPMLDDPGWFTRGCVVGDPSSSGQSTVIINQWVKERLLEIGYTEVDTVFSGNFDYLMGEALDRGDTVFGYRGWLGMSGWGNADTYQLTNGWEMPFCVIMTCGTGSFASSTSRSEGFLRAGSGATGVRGGIGAIGTATSGTHTRYNNCIYYGVWHGLIRDELTMGAALTRGKIELWLCYGNSEPQEAEIWAYWNNLMGDPALEVYQAYPDPFTVSHPSELPVGANTLPIVVTGPGDAPAAGAQVCALVDGGEPVVAFTDAAGRADLLIDQAVAGDLQLTVTQRNRHAFLATVPVVQYDIYVGYESLGIDDDGNGTSSGNGNGQLNPTESIELRTLLRNFGVNTAAGVEATLSSSDPYVTVTDAEEIFGNIAAGATAWSADDFDFTVSGGCPDGHVLRFDLAVTSGLTRWDSQFELPVVSAALGAHGTTLYNAGGNGLLDPGESIELSVQLVNTGGVTATGITGTLVSTSPFVTVTDGTGSFGTISIGGAGENTVDRFGVSAAANTYEGHQAGLLVITSFSGGAVDTAYVTVPVGQLATDDPFGPDAYGYMAFDNTDTAYDEAPTYSWIELDPTYGGNGTEVVLGDYGGYQDRSRIVDLPFTFRYYGVDYDRATVCSNGWLAMGETYLTNYRNWSLPSAGGPNAMLCPFWDNLYQSSGSSKAFEHYDSGAHTWTIEWSRFRNDYNGATETFEVILYDPAYHTTATGDGIIEFQYQTVQNYDPVNGYASVGIQNHDHSDGLLYTYWNDYVPGAATLTQGRAIRFVPSIGGSTTAVGGPAASGLPLRFAVRPNLPNPFNPITRLSYELPEARHVTVDVFNVRGQHVTRLVDGVEPAGVRQVLWDASGQSSGIYFYRVTAGDASRTRKMVLMK
ncbi:MAG: C25 family cysteine peptidase [Candidatus Eiseniibacteriota bacterium]|jgi:hypothetical protein